jgi:alpha-tubulin suppressor-like RCC1 family protein
VPGITNAAALWLSSAATARLANGTVVRWTSDKTRPVSVPLSGVAELIEGGMMGCVRFGDGRARCRGIDKPPAELAGTTQIAVNHAFSCALSTGGTVSCTGYNGRGQLGDGGVVDHATFAPVRGLASVAQVVVGTDHACARVANGTVKCWGDQAVLGDGTDRPRATPGVVPGLVDVVELAAGASSVCARIRDGSVRCWGNFGHPRIGGNDDAGSLPGSSLKPVDVPWLRGARVLALGMFHSCVLRADGTVACWGDNTKGQLGDGSMDAHSRPTRVLW